METAQHQAAESSALPQPHNANNSHNDISLDGGSGRPLFTPRAATGSSHHDSQLFNPNNSGVGGSSGGGGGATRAAGGTFPTPTPRRPGRVRSGVSPGTGGGGGGAAGGGAGAGTPGYRLMGNSGGGTSLAPRSPEDMSVAMSLGSSDEDDDGGALARYSPGIATPGTTGHDPGGASAGHDGSPEVGGDGQGEESLSDILSP